MPADARSLMAFIDASPSPFHAVANAAGRLEAAGFAERAEADAWPGPGRHFVRRGGSLVAWADAPGAPAHRPFHLVGAHTDSPNLRVKPRPDGATAGYRQLAVEVYGGALLNSWLDRDLGLSGRVTTRGERAPTTHLLQVDRAIARVPQLAIHLDRGVNEGLKLNPQTHLAPVWSVGPPDEGGLRRFVAKELGVPADDILGWDLMFHAVEPAALLGAGDELVSAPRIDNLASCHAAVEALLEAAAEGSEPGPATPLVCLFDHEEIGSQSSTGADSTILPTILERIVTARGGVRDDFHRALAGSRCVSADGAHAIHPNYPERHEPGHLVRIDGGPVLKLNSNVRYATDATTGAWFELACEQAEVPLQKFVVRSDIACGSTIGPVTAARLGVPTVDVGLPQLSMHSARELCAATEPARLSRALTAFLHPRS